MHCEGGYLTSKSIHLPVCLSVCGQVSCSAKGILVVFKQGLNLPLLTEHWAAM